MKPIELDDAKKLTGCLVELKVDGSRHTFDGRSIFSDRNIVRNDRFDHVVTELQKLPWQVRGELAIPGGNVLTLNKRENWDKAKFYIFEILAYNGKDYRKISPFDNRELIEKTLKKRNFKHLDCPLKFKDINEGWEYVVKEDAEGLVLKDLNQVFKLKKLTEEKLPIVGYEQGKQKGAFIIDRKGVVSRVSGTSEEFVAKYHKILNSAKIPMAEIEYCFLTEYGVPFQPRLRRVFER